MKTFNSCTATLALARPRIFTAAAGVQGTGVSVAAAGMTGAAANRQNDATGGLAWDPPV